MRQLHTAPSPHSIKHAFSCKTVTGHHSACDGVIVAHLQAGLAGLESSLSPTLSSDIHSDPERVEGPLQNTIHPCTIRALQFLWIHKYQVEKLNPNL